MAWKDVVDNVGGWFKRSGTSTPAPSPAAASAPPAFDATSAPGVGDPVDQGLRFLPAVLLVAGGILSALSEVVGVWAILGFLFVAVSPIVYWLQRIERRLAEAARKR